MTIDGLAERHQEVAGKEGEAQLTGEPSPRFHGTLTRELHGILERAKPGRETVPNLERSLKEGFGDGVAVRIAQGAQDSLLLADELMGRADALLARIGERRARQVIAALEEVIARREQQGDYWPEGRLNLGIAYACLGEYEDARRWLDDAANMLKYPSYIPRSEQMLA
jgi:tetratricopeptide (TPR) repeat protein